MVLCEAGRCDVIYCLATEKHLSFHIMHSLQRPMTLIEGALVVRTLHGGITTAITNITKLDKHTHRPWGGGERSAQEANTDRPCLN